MTFWVLKGVSFEVKRGEVVGIPSATLRASIGRNGAGKTTLLKILSRITEPTEGRAKIHGRVGEYLLEWRYSFDMLRTSLGMKRAEIDRKFDETCAELAEASWPLRRSRSS